MWTTARIIRILDIKPEWRVLVNIYKIVPSEMKENEHLEYN